MEGGVQERFIKVGSAPRSKPLHFYIPFLAEKKKSLFHMPSIDESPLLHT